VKAGLRRSPTERSCDLIPLDLRVRARDSNKRFVALKKSIARQVNGSVLRRVCIYATGSYGRGEASPASDADLFMVDTADEAEGRLSNIEQILLRSQLITICRSLELPEFSGDAEFLAVHCLSDMIKMLGGRQDDAVNAFTARLLLLLESRCLYNERVYQETVEAFVEEYFRDYEGKEDAFLPAFLVNDIVRYWKTVCLNYEYSRGKRLPELRRDASLRREYKLKNLKLKFSRVMTCYSALATLTWLHRDGTVTPEDVTKMVLRSPIQRIAHLGSAGPALRKPAVRVLEEYSWFVETLTGDKASSIKWLSRESNVTKADRHAHRYREGFVDLLKAAGREGELLHYVLM